MENVVSMNDFIEQVVDRLYKPKTAQNVAKSIAVTAIVNCISIPFGFTYVGYFRSKSKSEIRKNVEKKLYGEFKSGWFDDYDQQEIMANEKLKYERFLDVQSMDQKMKILVMALNNPTEYSKFIQRR